MIQSWSSLLESLSSSQYAYATIRKASRCALIGLRFLVDPKPWGDGMGLFDFLKPKDNSRKMLVDLLTHNADVIEKSEGKDRSEAEYLAACLIIDDLSRRPNGREGYQQMMEILKADYPQHLNDVITYVGWSTGKLHFKPDYDAYMRARHAK